MLYAYCICRTGDAGPDYSLTGVDDAPVILLENTHLGVWLSESEPVSPTPERLRQHDGVVQAALLTATPLPVRFGALFPDEAAVRQMLAAREAELLATLERVQGRVEMGVTIFWDVEQERARLLAERPDLRLPQEPPATGREYLERRRRARILEEELQRRAEELLEQVAAALESESDPSMRRLLPQPQVAGMVAHLVRREAVGSYRRRGARVRAMLPEVNLTISGPWAPYSFVGG